MDQTDLSRNLKTAQGFEKKCQIKENYMGGIHKNTHIHTRVPKALSGVGNHQLASSEEGPCRIRGSLI